MSAAMSTTGKIEKGAYVSEWVALGNGQWIHKYNILGTTIVDYAAWEPYTCSNDNGHFTRSHSTVTTYAGLSLGDVTMRDIPADMDALPCGDERVNAVRAWYRANEEAARALVLAAFPNDFAA